jgi:ABC-type transporter MlaC component
MRFELSNKFYKSLGCFGSDEQVREDADGAERTMILDALNASLANYSGDQTIDWFDYEVELQKGSPLYEVYVPGRVLLNELLSTVAVRSVLGQENMSDAELIRVTHSGKLEVFDGYVWRDLLEVGYLARRKDVQASMEVLADIAKEAGGCLWTNDSVIIDQWLQFYGFDVPTTVAQVRNLISYFEFDFSEVDHFGTYWGQIIADDPSMIVLSAEQRLTIRNITTRLIPRNERLLDVLFRETRTGFAQHDNAAVLIKRLISHSISQEYAKQYLELLGWFGAGTDQVASEQQLGQVLITAILLDLNPFVGNERGRKSVGSFELYSPNYVGKPSAIVLQELSNHIINNQWATHDTAPLAIHLWLAQMAPEFLVRRIPAYVLIGSVEWVAFCRGVALVEAATSGASRVLTFTQIMAYAELEPVSDPLARLRNLAMIDPIVDWALINQVVTTTELKQAEKETTERAMTVFEEYVDGTHLARAYTSSIPSREEIARAAVRSAAPTCDSLEAKTLYQRPGLYASPTAMSMVDLHMSGDLVGGEWDLRGVFPDSHAYGAPDLLSSITNQKNEGFYDPSIVSIHKRYPSLRRLAPNNDEYHRQLRDYLGNLNNAVIRNVKMALSHMPFSDLETFLGSKITFFTLRSAATETSSNRWGGWLTLEADYETQQGKDAVTGRFGIVMCASHGNTVTCYELFTLRGELRRNNTLGALIASKGKLQGTARMDFTGDLKAHQRATDPELLPITLKEYTHGIPETSSASSDVAIIDKLGELAAPATPSLQTQSVYKNFSNTQIVRIAEFIVNHRPMMTFDELEVAATVPTVLETQRKKGEENATYIVDLVVPFKKCIEDLSSGEHNKMVDGMYGCVMDVIAVGGAFVGAGARALSISAKAISTASKAVRLTKLAFVTSVSLFNPVDGVPTALFGVGKLVHKGALRFNRQAQEMLGLAQSQLHKLNGRHKTYDLVRAANRADTTEQGTWRPLGETGDTLTVVAARNAHQWYALDRLGKPWGPKLNNFTFQAPIQLPRFNKTLPVSYTRQFIEQSLPLARTKIDNAINVMTRLDLTRERNAIIKVLMGSNSSDAFERLLNYLRLIRADFAGLSISNMFLDPLKNTNNIAAFNVDAYKQWKEATDKSATQFIEIYTPNLNKHFIGLGFNHDVVADDLIHELFHGASQTDDVSYARDAGRNGERGQSLDVAPLLNLASGRLPVTEEGDACHASSKAFENADSLAVTTSLLSQLYADRGSYELNMSTLRGALEANPGRAIDEPVLITLNNSIAPKPAGGSRPGSYMD